MQLAEDLGMKVERRPVPEEELSTFEEAGACGTAAVISPIERIDDLENKNHMSSPKTANRGPYVPDCITSCVPFNTATNPIHTAG